MVAFVGVLIAACLSVAVVFGLVIESARRLIVASGWLTGLALLGVGVPAATGIAIFRYRLYDVDVVIRRTLVYGALTATLGATYLALVLVAGLAVGGRTSRSRSRRSRWRRCSGRRVRASRALVDERFLCRRYDATLTLEEFGAQLRDELDLEALSADVRRVVHETVQPAHVGVAEERTMRRCSRGPPSGRRSSRSPPARDSARRRGLG